MGALSRVLMWLVLAWCGVAVAADRSGFTPEERHWLTAHPVIRVLADPQRPPFSVVDAQGHYTGYVPDLLGRMSERLGVRLAYVPARDWRDAQARMATGQADLLGPISPSPERARLYLFGTEIYRTRPVVMGRSEHPPVRDLAELAGESFVAVEGYPDIGILRERLPRARVTGTTSLDEAVARVAAGEADLVAGNAASLTYLAAQRGVVNLKVLVPLTSDDRSNGFAVARTEPALRSLLDKAYGAVSENERTELRRRWFGSVDAETPADRATSALGLSDAERQWVASHRTLRIGYSDSAPITYRGSDGRAAGLAVELVDELARRAGFTPDWRFYPGWPAALAALARREVDALGNVSASALASGDPLTAPYMPLQNALFLRQDAPFASGIGTLGPGRRVVAVSDSSALAALRTGYPQQPWLARASAIEALQALRQGDAEAAVGNLAVFDYTIRQQGFRDLRVAGLVASTASSKLAVRADHPLTLAVLDKAIARLTPERRDAIMGHWFRVEAQQGVDPRQITRSVLTVAVPLIVGLLILGYWALRLRREIAGRRQAEAVAVDARAQLGEILDTLPGVVYEFAFTPPASLSITFASSVASRLFGFTPDAVQADTNVLTRAIVAEDRVRFLADITAAAALNREFQSEYRVRHASDGAVRWLRSSGQCVQRRGETGIYRGYVADITELKRLEDEASAARQRVTDITNSVPGFVYEIDADAEYRLRASFVSQGVRALMGLEAAEVMAAPDLWYGVVHPDDADDYADHRRRTVEQHLSMDHTFRIVHRLSGETRWMHTLSVPVAGEPGFQRWRGLVSDITEQKQFQAELAAARVAAEDAAKAKSEFLANMSHEIRTPMNAIIGLSHLALKTELSARQHDYLAKIHNSAQSLLGIINDILDLSKIEAGKLDVERIEFDLLEVLDNLASLVSVRAQDKGLEFLISAAPGLPYFLRGDPLRIGQVLLNLAGNAVKFTAHGQVLVSVSEVPDSRRDGQATLRFAVTDTGIGLTPEQVGKMFQAFSQADTSTSRKYGGTGLGLAISKQLTELMDGEIGVDSEAGKGSTFWFTVRLEISVERRQAPHLAEALAGRRALVVDDNRSARDIVESYLVGFGMAVRQASGGPEAIAAAQAAEAAHEPFDLALMDWQMPGMDGFEAARGIRQVTAAKVILVTAFGREDVASRATQEQLDGFLVKPVNPSMLLDASLQALFGRALSGGGRRAAKPGDEGAGELAGLKVLLAEDNEINQQVAREVLEGFGVVVDIADNGHIAVNKLKAGVIAYDLVLMDMQMPEMDGLAATRAIRADATLPPIPILAMTANAMEADRQQCLAAGMSDFISKPFKPKELLRLLKRWGRGEAADPLPGDVDGPGIPGDIQLFNREDGLGRLGSATMLHKLGRQFFDQNRRKLDELPGLLAAGDQVAAVRLAHSLAGSAGLLGFERLAQAGMALEQRLKGKAAHVTERAAVAAALADTEAAFAAIMTASPEVAVAAAVGTADPAAVPALLDTLTGQIEGYDSLATETVTRLRAALGHAAPPALDTLVAALDGFDFEAAAAALVELRAATAPAR